MAAFGFNYTLKALPEALHRGTKGFLENFGPFSLKKLLQSFGIIMG